MRKINQKKSLNPLIRLARLKDRRHRKRKVRSRLLLRKRPLLTRRKQIKPLRRRRRQTS